MRFPFIWVRKRRRHLRSSFWRLVVDVRSPLGPYRIDLASSSCASPKGSEPTEPVCAERNELTARGDRSRKVIKNG